MGKVRSIWCSGFLLSFALLPFALADDVIISEVMAANRETLADRDGDYPDWVELYNCGTETVNLGGWHLTDDPQSRQKWAFPAIVLPPKGFLLVFASGKSLSTTGDELHTNFRISSDGEFVGLVRPDDTFSSALPQMPRQIRDASYGFPVETTATEILAPGATARYFVPVRSSDLPEEWNEADFDDSAWAQGEARFGFEVGDDPVLGELIGTDLRELMYQRNASLFMRISLEIPDPSMTGAMRLRAHYNDGFVAFINGVEVGRRNATNTRYNSGADSVRPIEDVLVEETVDLVIPSGTLREDRNVLAIQAMNRRSSNRDFLFIPAVDVVAVTSVSPEAKYFDAPTPATPNSGAVFDGITDAPVLSPGSTLFVDPLTISLEAASAGSVTHLTVDGTSPTEASPVYEGPFEIDQFALVRARSFEPGNLPSAEVKESYLQTDAALAASFSSNIPVVVITTFGRRASDRLITRMHMQIVDGSDDARATLTGATRDFAGDGLIKTRGSSTGGRQKVSFGFEIQDDVGDDLDVSLLGMPAESDWILYGALNFDRALIRNPFMYELSNQVGRYAVRTRFCEIFVHSNRTRGLAQADYMGVYSLCEKIKRGPDRVDVEPLLPEDNAEPEISGGYILKIDRPDPGGDTGFTGGAQAVLYVDPKEEDVTPQQGAWIRRYLDQMAAALRDTDQPADDIFEREYTKFIDVDSWIDHHLLNEFSKNPDEFRLSTYFFKRRGGPVEFGPIWDFDRTLGPDEDNRAQMPEGWASPRLFGWWGLVLKDPLFLERYRARWIELRQGPVATSNLHAIVDGMAEEIREAQARNNNRWRVVSREGWEIEVEQLKRWIQLRVDWMDSEFISAPVLSHPGGPVSSGFEVTMSSPQDLKIYFTVDGSDPRGRDDAVSESAMLYGGPLRIDENTRIRARAGGVGALWSVLVEAFYVTTAPPFVVTEIMYNPPSFDGDTQRQTWNYEFVEFQNVGAEPLDLTGYEWVEPRARETTVKFDFFEGGLTMIAPGEIIVVARRLERFRERYGDGLPVFGEIGGNLQNSGETIRVVGPDGFPVIEFSYADDWDQSTDGFGKSLVIRDPRAAPETWALRESWRASTEIGGSPGRVDPGSGGQLVADVNLDGRRSVTDAVGLLLAISGKSAFPCATAEANEQLLDANSDGRIDVSDAVHLLDFLFRSETASMLGSDCMEIDGCRNACAN